MADIWLRARVAPEDVSWWFDPRACKEVLTDSLGRRSVYMSIDADKGSDCWLCIYDDGQLVFGESAA